MSRRSLPTLCAVTTSERCLSTRFVAVVAVRFLLLVICRIDRTVVDGGGCGCLVLCLSSRLSSGFRPVTLLILMRLWFMIFYKFELIHTLFFYSYFLVFLFNVIILIHTEYYNSNFLKHCKIIFRFL